MRAILTAAVLGWLACVAIAPAQDKKGATAFITDVGVYKLYDGKLTIEIQKSKNWLHVIFPGAKAGSGRIREIEKSKGWFVYPLSATEVVIFEGGEPNDEILVHYKYERNDGEPPMESATYTIIHTRGEAKLLKLFPKVVVDKLPDSFRK